MSNNDDFKTKLWGLLQSLWIQYGYKVKRLLQKVIDAYYKCRFHINKLIAAYRKPVNAVVDTVTVLASLWCIGNVTWQIGFDVSPETSARLLLFNKYIICLFAVVQIYKLINYIHDSDFNPVKEWFNRIRRGFRSFSSNDNWADSGQAMWQRIKDSVKPSNIWQRFVSIWRYFFVNNRVPISEVIYAAATSLYFWYMPPEGVSYGQWYDILWHKYAISLVVCVISFNEISRLGITVLSKRTSPTALFVCSFIVIILIGTGLLMMPKCCNTPLTFFEALFTSTSAVCVNGLSIIDIPNTLTTFGLVILLILIQIGGIGIMTFTCFFALSLTGRASLQNRFVIKELISADNMTNIFQTLKRIIYVTVSIEAASAWIIYVYLETRLPDMPTQDLVFYSIFHSISAFCNAGFTNVEQGLMNPDVAGLRPLQIIIAVTVILGGIGFPLQSATIDWVKIHSKMLIYRILRIRNNNIFRSRLINANNRIMFYTHLALVIIGTFIFMLTENRFTQSDSPIFGKLCDSFFLSVCSRTAGFNIVDINLLSPLSLMTVTFLMWIGCAPLSTGGGIKVTTFAVAMLNVRSVLRRRDSIEIFGRRITPDSIQRAFAVIMLSAFVMVSCAVLMKIFDPQLPTTKLIFESCSAVFTGGMTLDITNNLSLPSHMVLLVEMFIGRIGILAFIMSFVEPAKKQYYSYPHESIMV